MRTMRFVTTLILALAFCLVVTACTPAHSLNVDNVAGTFNNVADRHDKYVNADTTLAPVEKQTYLRDTSLLRAAIKQAQATTGVTPASAPATQP